MEEERRLAYVAITRAKDRLFLIASRERLLYGHTQYNVRSRFIDEIEKEYLAEEGTKPKARPHAEFGENKKVRISNELFERSSVSAAVGKTARPETLAVGDRVRHMTFGSGTVLSVREMGADILYEIAFDTVGTKKLMATYAKLKRE